MIVLSLLCFRGQAPGPPLGGEHEGEHEGELGCEPQGVLGGPGGANPLRGPGGFPRGVVGAEPLGGAH